MSPEARSASYVLQSLRDDLVADVSAMRKALSAIERVLAPWRLESDEVTTGFVALQLHGYYGALESIFERIGRVVDGGVPNGQDWHRQLLQQMQSERAGRRPALLEPQAAAEARELLGFRHFLRHHYGVDLDPVKVDKMVATAQSLTKSMAPKLNAFDAFLAATIAETETEREP